MLRAVDASESSSSSGSLAGNGNRVSGGSSTSSSRSLSSISSCTTDVDCAPIMARVSDGGGRTSDGAAPLPAIVNNTHHVAGVRDLQGFSAASLQRSQQQLQQQQQQPPQQRPLDKPSSSVQPIICVPNQQAPYPHMQPSMRKVPIAKQTMSHRSSSVQQQGHMHPSKLKPIMPHGAQVVAPVTLPNRQLHPPNSYSPRGNVHIITSRTGAAGSRSHVAHSQKPIHQQPHQNANFSRTVAIPQSQNPSKLPYAQSTMHHIKVSSVQTAAHQPQSNGSAAGHKSMSHWMPPLPQGPTNDQQSHLLHHHHHHQQNARERSNDNLTVEINNRKVKLSSETDQTSLYSHSRRWVRNDVTRKDQPGVWDCLVPLPRPLSSAQVEKENGDASILLEDDSSEMSSDHPVDEMSISNLLESHVRHFKGVRKRSRDERMQRIARFRPRLALLLPPM